MKTLLCKTIVITAMLLVAACHRNDIRTITYTVDQLQTQEAAELINTAIKRLPAILEVKPDLNARTITIVFDGRVLYLKNIEYEIVNAGFSLPHWSATKKQKEKLPEALQ